MKLPNAILALFVIACSANKATAPAQIITPKALRDHCEQAIGDPHVEKITDHVWVAVGYDLANTILIQTTAGNVIVDTSVSPRRAAEVKAALTAVAPGPTKAIIYTHSHIDHIGGTSVWWEPGVEIWATDAFRTHFLKQYALFQPAEARRGAGQFGEHVDLDALPCSGLGRRIDMEGARENGTRMPTKTFSGQTKFNVGGMDIVLVEAHGETHDHLFVWLPSEKALLPGDNFYRSFPNLYTIRGTSPRPVDTWIESLDAMRALSPQFLVPSHNRPITDAAEIAVALRDYRDAIQWVRDETVRGANRGESVDALVKRIRLPGSLVNSPYLQPFYGQIDWSVRAIYGGNLGWFDERPGALYPPEFDELAKKEVEAMGGTDAVKKRIAGARSDGDSRWALYLSELLQRSGEKGLEAELATDYEAVAAGVFNTNGRAYLLESAYRARKGHIPEKPKTISDELVREIPLETFFKVMASRLKTDDTSSVAQSMRFTFADEKKIFTVTLRNGVAEVAAGEPLPGTPAPIATIVTDGMTWRQLALDRIGIASALTSGKLKIEGSLLATKSFMDRFERGL